MFKSESSLPPRHLDTKRGSSVCSFHTADHEPEFVTESNNSESSSVGLEFNVQPPPPLPTTATTAKQKRVLFSVRTWPKSLMISNGSVQRLHDHHQQGLSLGSPKNQRDSGNTTPSVLRTPITTFRRHHFCSQGSSTSILNTTSAAPRSLEPIHRFTMGVSASFDELAHFDDNNMTDNDSVNHFGDDIGGRYKMI